MTVLAAVDGEEDFDRVVEVAHDIGSTYGEDVVVLHVISKRTFNERQANRGEYYLDNAEEDAREVAQRVTHETLGSSDGCTFLGEVGDVTRMILDTAHDLDARYLVIGGRKHTPAGKVLFGSTTQSILLSAGCPVVAVFQDDE